ncbi:rho GTPase-activating protein 21-like isoform X2 [Osmerus eperlanus]|uniref:rho GTPase-activating protein 21-like isoform X2 n=1 Tax=Osmerus eperlanus TaxID=29151 RepID=UPI002E14D024
MLAQRSGLSAGRAKVSVPLREHPDLGQLEVGGPRSRSPSPATGPCPWARLAGVDGCLSEPHCLWFQLLARSYWGDVELGLAGVQHGVSWARLREASGRNCVRSRAKQKGGRGDQSEASVSPGTVEEEAFSWPGPKTLRLRRTSLGFGFTLRHFIVYPPESAVHSSLKDEDNGSRGRQRNRLEPMDTIFVKQVKEGGPAHGAGLCTGDRIVKVNGESIIGKTYSQVIALIQNSDTSLELCVMPKDEDILQLAYSQDAYLKGNEAYSGNAQNIPEPPPICYPRIETKVPGMAQAPDASPSPVPAQGPSRRPPSKPSPSEAGYRLEVLDPPSPPTPVPPKTQTVACVCSDGVRTPAAASPDAVDRGSRSLRAGPSHRTEENRYPVPPEAASARPRPLLGKPGSPSLFPSSPGSRPVYPDTHPSPSPSPLRTPVTPAGGDAFTPTPSPSLYSPSPPPPSPFLYSPSPPAPATPSPSPHKNIDWRNYTTYKDYIDARRLHTYGCRTIQERLDSLRAAANPNAAYAQQAPPPAGTQQRVASGSQFRRRSASHDRGAWAVSGGGVAVPLRSASQESLGGAVGDPGATPIDWSRSSSQDALPCAAPVGGAKPRARSCDYLGRQGEAGGAVPGERGGVGGRSQLEDRLLLFRGEEARASRQGAVLRALPQPHRTSAGVEAEAEGRGGAGAGLAVVAPAFSKGASEPALTSRTDSLTHTALPAPSRPSRLPVKNPPADPSPALSHGNTPGNNKTTDPLKDQRHIAMGNHLGHASPLQRLHLRGRADSLQEGRQGAGLSLRSSSCSGPSKTPVQKQLPAGSAPNGALTLGPKVKEGGSALPVRTNGSPGEGVEGLDATVVVLRRERLSGPTPLRHPSYILAVNDHEGGAAARPPSRVLEAGGSLLAGEAQGEGQGRRLADQRKASWSSNLGDSLDSIPFIDEPSSPSMDLEATHITASAVISGTPVITTISPSPTSPSPLIRRQLSHDQDSLRLTIIDSDSGTKTERSKSCDEGLDNYREEGLGRSIQEVPGLKGLRKAVDRSSEDSGSRRDSSSDIFSDATKEGWLHFKQLNSDKSKRAGGGMRPWKQMYAVLRGHTLCLYKDKKEGLAHANAQAEVEPQPISIKACLIDISYSDTRRKNVLRLTTSDCEFLFQAEDREDMLAWIRVIQENSNLDEENSVFTSRDLISRKIREYNTLMSPTGSKTEPSPRPSRQSLSIRHTLLGGKQASSPISPNTEDRRNVHKDDTSPPKDKGTWRKGIPGLMRKPFERKPSPGVTFGVRLDDCPPAVTNKFVPLIVEVCCHLVEERGLEYTGIYRVPGNNAAISNMQEELNNKGMNDINIQDDKWRDLNVISSLLKSFFRKLPEPLFTNDKYADFIEANRTEDPVERLKVLKRLLHELPDHHYETLKFLSAHLKTVAENSEKNKMEPRNLAIVFGPTLVRSSEDNMTHMVIHMPDQYRIVETLIQHYDWFFTEDGDGEPVTLSRQESAVESQPVPNIDHLLTNIGRTGASQGEVSDSPTSDSAKSKGSWGSGKDQCSRDLLVSSIFAAASRKRKKPKEKPQPSSSDDDLDAVFLQKEPAGAQQNHQEPRAGPDHKTRAEEKDASWGAVELTPKTRKEQRNSFFLRDRPSSRQPSPAPSPPPKLSASPSPRLLSLGKSSLSDPPSHLEDTSDLGTISYGASAPRARPRKWFSGAAPDLAGAGASAGAEVSSITSDYSTTSSVTFLTGAESSALSPELQCGEEADDERSELVSEGRPTETDSESDFPVFAHAGGGARSASAQIPTERVQEGPQAVAAAADGCGGTPKQEARRLLPTHRLIECDTLSRRRSLRQKTDSDSSAEGGAGGGGEGRAEASTRLSRVLEVMKKGRSTGSLSSSSRSESERPEPSWHLKITERLKLRVRSSADDMFGLGAQRSRAAPDARGRKKSLRRRHTMGGQRDFAELAVINDWREQGGVDQAAELSAVDRLRPKCSSQDFSIRDWIARERCRAGAPDFSLDEAPRAVPEDAGGLGPERPSPSASPGPHSLPGDRVNGGGGGLQGKTKGSQNLVTDAHPHKLSGAQVVRSRFYQYL